MPRLPITDKKQARMKCGSSFILLHINGCLPKADDRAPIFLNRHEAYLFSKIPRFFPH